MTPSAAIAPSLDVVNFSSALTTSASSNGPQWLISAASRNFELPLPDGTSLSISIKVADSTGLQSKDYITINAWMNRKLIDANGSEDDEHQSGLPMSGLLRTEAFPLEMQCLPPKPRYKNSQEEPDDNSLARRSTRFAFAQLDTNSIQNHWTTQEKAAFVWVQLYIIMSMLPSEEAFNITINHDHLTRDLIHALLDANLAIPHPVPGKLDEPAKLITYRSIFWQSAFPFSHNPWLSAIGHWQKSPVDIVHDVPALLDVAANVYHPRRPRKPTVRDGPVYTRHILELGQTLTFEPVSSEDAEFVRLFTKWQNDERVANGWRQKGGEEIQKRYLQSIESNPSTIGLVGKWDGEPWGYVEVYWAKESNIGRFYNAEDYDRGFHALVGEQHFRGPHRVRSWMGSLIHMLFVQDARTQRVVLEPRATNSVMINYTTMCGGHVEKLIDLPHKRAALVICPREGFFQLCPLGPLTTINTAYPRHYQKQSSETQTQKKPEEGVKKA